MPKLIVAVLFFAGLLAGCNRAAASDTAGASEYRKISAEQAREMITTLNDFILLDVRTEAEYRERRIEGAMLIPDNEIKDRAAPELPDTNAVILVYCRSGRRSAAAARELISMGYVNIYDFGGIIDWPYETVSN